MDAVNKNIKTCKKGHKYYKTSICPACPVCEREQKPASGFLSKISAPARRVLESKGIESLRQLFTFSQDEILSLHGMAPVLIQNLEMPRLKKDYHLKNNKQGN